ncbi:hypothetical protein SAMN06297387_13032 [Streptomyces zhaozhouensis]|uniref:Uncharacterized protein n=1 Tax=Streptomyces zhaozhouensis TaxID=1300267 RepID=A0A286E8Y6_9ACTN|nr:hypothetical protein [Streptomyces zhaozhouensis]SOD67366.1 hypothetical protein SAMN06297387_13032 [Streptomyces zhaozhouensis]
MAMCKNCGADKRRWPRSCPRCRAGAGRTEAATDTAANAADLATSAGLFGGIWQAVTAAVRWVVRALT